MFRSLKTCLSGVMLSLILGFSTPVFGQQDNVNIAELKSKTQAFYDEGKYSEALNGYSILSDTYPGDAMYRYYQGVCMVKLNRDLDEAIEHLYFSSSRGVPEDSYFYLGLAYHREYNFSEAEKFFVRFEREGSRQQQKDLHVKQYINNSRSASEITAFYNPYKVLNVVFINLLDSTQFSQVKMRGGVLSRKPDKFFRGFEDRKDLSSLMFLPEKMSKGDYVYYAGYSGSGKEGSQLFRVKKGSARMWGDPEPLKELNSDMDEILPYFDPIEKDLYFASNGRDGVGGFDLYKSHYDLERDEWSEPMNMGFPVNSVMDDYLLLPGNDLGMVMFFTSRESKGNDITVYRVQLMEPKQPLSASNTRKMKEIALLGGVAEEVLAEIESVEAPPSKPVGEAVVPVKADHTDVKVVETTKPPVEVDDYQLTLAKALQYQAGSDSLSELATNARIKVRESDDPNDKWVWQKQIMVWEKKARDEQEKADELFAALNEKSEPAKINAHPETIVVDTVINEITVYSYSETAMNSAEASKDPDPVKASGVKKEDSSEESNSFAILTSSPYSEANPIPVDVPLPQGVFYRIQLGAYSKAISQDAFGGLSPITGEYLKDRGLTKYYAGKFKHYKDASLALLKVKKGGFPDSFIVAYYNGQKTSTTKAQALE